MTESGTGRRGVFLDRDGVLNRNVRYPDTGEYESPRAVRDLEVFPGVPRAIRDLRSRGFLLFLISNQPNHAKGKTSLAELEAIGAAFRQTLEDAGSPLDGYYYCYHHPAGVTPGYSGPCRCRKPGTLFVEQAVREFALDTGRSWLVGDRESDIRCGQAAGMHTILIQEPTSADRQAGVGPAGGAPSGRRGPIPPIVGVEPDFSAPTLEAAVEIILRSEV